MNNASKTILVVEDDLNIRESMKDALEGEGYRVVIASNGKEALERVREVPHPCLVLLDMMMPVMGGREFIDAMLADVLLAPIPILVISAIADAETTRGAAAFLKKPPDLDLLLKKVERFAEESRA